MIYYLTALINGFFNSVNRMTNVRAGKLFGTANGALINYVEATVLSLLLMLVLKNGQESFATIDLALIDLVSAKAEFVKIGAATGYIRRADSIDSIFCSTLPAGILSEADIQLSCRRLAAGDCIIMVSDGVANAKKNANWVCETLMGIPEEKEPETIAEIVLKEAVIHKRGAVNDDMTVIAAKILEK